MKRVLLLCLVAGCANPTNSPQRDLAVASYDFATPHDLAMGGGKDAGGGMDLGGGGCTHVAQWPGLLAQGGYDPMYLVTLAESADQMMPPFNALDVEDYHAMGVPY